MAFTRPNWGRASSPANEPLVTLQDGGKNGCFRTYNYFAPGVAATSGDTQATIAAAGYFNDVQNEISTGDAIYAYSVRDSTLVSYVATNTDGVITTNQFNFADGAIGTVNIQDGAVTYAKIQNMVASSLLGNPTGGASSPTAITLGNGLGFVGGDLTINDTYMNYATGTITAAQWNGMYAVPIELVPAPGAGVMIVLDQLDLVQDFATTQYAGGGAVIAQYGNTNHGGGVQAGSGTIAAATVNAIAADTLLPINKFSGPTLTATTVNAGLFLSNQTGAFTTGDGDWSYKFWYKLIAAA